MTAKVTDLVESTEEQKAALAEFIKANAEKQIVPLSGLPSVEDLKKLDPEGTGHYGKAGVSGEAAIIRRAGLIAGRKRAISMLDSLLLKNNNMEKIEAALQEMVDNNPAYFFKNFVMPLIPKTIIEGINAPRSGVASTLITAQGMTLKNADGNEVQINGPIAFEQLRRMDDDELIEALECEYEEVPSNMPTLPKQVAVEVEGTNVGNNGHS